MRATFTEMALKDFVECVPGRCGGRPTFIGHRLEPWHVWTRLQDGDTIDLLVEDYPDIPREAFEAVRDASDYERNQIARMAIAATFTPEPLSPTDIRELFIRHVISFRMKNAVTVEELAEAFDLPVEVIQQIDGSEGLSGPEWGDR